jgi:hypothetical protein
MLLFRAFARWTLFAASAALPLLGAGTISGVVLDAHTGLPVTAASIRLHPEHAVPGGWIHGRVEADGKFRVLNVAPGYYGVAASAPGYLETQGSRFSGPSVEVLETGQVRPAVITMRLIPAATISGRITTSDGTAIPGAAVTVLGLGPGTLTNKDGSFELGYLRECPRDCALRVHLKERTQRPFVRKTTPAGEVGPAGWTDFPMIAGWRAGEQVRNLEIRIEDQPLVTFEGSVTGGSWAAGEAEVLLLPANEPLYPDHDTQPLSSNGEFRIPLVSPGKYRLIAKNRRALPERVLFETAVAIPPVLTAAAFQQRFDARESSASISGVVKLNGKPFYQQGFSLSFMRRDGASGGMSYARADVREDGTFEAKGLIPGKWSAGLTWFSMSGRKPAMNVTTAPGSSMFDLKGGENTTVELNLLETVLLSGRVLQPAGSGEAAINRFVTSINPGEPGVVHTMLAKPDGTFATVLPKGTYRVTGWSGTGPRDIRSLPPCATAVTITADRDLTNLELAACPVPR